MIQRGTADISSWRSKESLSCAGEAGGREVEGASRPHATVPDVRLSPCPIMLDNCMAHSRLHPCSLDIKVQRLAGCRALWSFELALCTAVTQAPAHTTHTRIHTSSSDLHLPRETLSGLQFLQAKGHDSQPHVVTDWQQAGFGGSGFCVFT